MVEIEGGSVRFGDDFSVSFQRTLRVPDDGRAYPLPPGLGMLPVYPVEALAERLPPQVRARGGVIIPMYQREALWLGFRSAPREPRAVKIAVGGYNVLSGARETGVLRGDPQDYVVCPPQVWLDGIRTERGSVRQFVAVSLGQGKSLEASQGGVELRGGLQLTVFRARPGALTLETPESGPLRARSMGMGFGLGGTIQQKLYPDPHGVAAWDTLGSTSLEVHVLSAQEFRRWTGLEPPPTPIDAHAYVERGLPWFELYDEERGDLGVSDGLRGATTLREHDERSRDGGSFDESLAERELEVVRIVPKRADPA